MGILGKLVKNGMVGGLAGMAADKAGINIGDIARNGGFGVMGLALAKKKKQEEEATSQGRAGPGSDIRMMSKKKGGKVSAVEAVHKHERAKHKGQPLTKMAKGGSTASKRADGCATQGKTKGRFV